MKEEIEELGRGREREREGAREVSLLPQLAGFCLV